MVLLYFYDKKKAVDKLKRVLEIFKESNITIFALVFITSLFDSIVNIVTVMPVYNTYGILNLVIKGILIIPLVNSILSLLVYNLFKTSILKLKED